MKTSLLFLVGLVLSCLPGCWAATSVSGKVTDENGLAVASARLELRSNRAAAPLLATSDIGGSFFLEVPAPGEYSIRVLRAGFFLFESRVVVDVGAASLQITVNHTQELFQSVDVEYAAPPVDPQQLSEKKQLTGVQITRVPYPASQDLRNSLPMLQGVVQDAGGRLHFNGAATEQANFTLDGFNISDPVTGRFEARLSIESVRAVDVESSAYSVEKGKGSAATVDVKTAMGDDRWRFGATNFIPGVTTQENVHINKWTPRLMLSGPLSRGRAWFSNSFDAFYDVDTVTGLPKGQDRSRALSTSNLTRTQWNLTPANILTASFLHNYADQARNGLSFLDPVETTINRRQSLYFASLKDQVYFHRGALIEFGFASSRTFTREAPQGDQTFVYLPSGKRGNYFLDLTRHTSREEWSTNAYLPAVEWMGSHQLMVGANVQRIGYERSADRHDYRVLRSDMSVAREVYFTGSGLASRRNLEVSSYIQDRWSPVSGLLVEAGMRADWNEVVRDVMMSPRLSAAYAPKWMHETKVAAGIGVFRDSLNLGTISRHQDQVSISTFFDPAGAIRRGPIETSFQIVDRDLRMPRYKTLDFSVERKLPLEFYGKAAYIRRGGRRGLTFVNELPMPSGLAPIPIGGLYQLRNTRNDRYDAVEVTVRRTFGGRFEFSAGYTRSNSRSDAIVDYSLENPIFAPQGPGPFAWDAPNRFLTWGWAPLPKRLLPGPLAFLTRDTDVAYLAEYRTGFPFSVVNEESFLLGNPNGRRLPSYFNVNLHLERRFPFLHYLWAWRVGVNNLTNSGNPNVVNNVVESPTFLAYGRGQQRAANVRLRFLGRR